MKHVYFERHDVRLTSIKTRKPEKFRVVYGQQISKDLNYSDACKELGECLLHSMCCKGELEEGANE